MNEADRQEKIQLLLNEAKICPMKGRMYVFEQFKRRLMELEPTAMEITDACAKLQKYLNLRG